MRAPLTLLLLLLPVAAREADDPDRARAAAAKSAVAWLEKAVPRLPDSAGSPRKPFTYAVTGLVFLAERPPGASGTGRDRVREIRSYLTRWVDGLAEQLRDPEALPDRYGAVDSRRVCQYTWPLSVAALFFAELEERGLDRRQAHAMLERILDLLVEAQEGNGGWGHGRIRPRKAPDGGLAGMGGYPSTLLSSSNCVAIAVGLAGAMEGHERDEAIRLARDYYRAARLSNGSFPYDPSQRQSGSAKTNAGRTAGALYAWHALGMERDDRFAGSARYLMENLEWVVEGHGSPCLNMFHGALACRMLGEEEWKRFRDLYDARLIAGQEEGGALRCICENKAFGVTCDSAERMGGIGAFAEQQQAYTTALHAFVLLLDRGHLKVLDRRRPGGAITRKGK